MNVLLKFCRLLACLARDLRQELYPRFPEILTKLALTLDHTDVATIESVFSTLSFLFKYLLKELIGDIEAVFRYILL